jgi:hypothetical protein
MDNVEIFLDQMIKVFYDIENINKIVAIKYGIDKVQNSRKYTDKVKYKIIKYEELLMDSLMEDIKHIINNKDTRILLDISLSHKQEAEANKNKEPFSFKNFDSVLFANELVSKGIIQKKYIIFYTRPEAFGFRQKKFIDDTEGKWGAPLARPGFGERDESIYISYFIKQVMTGKIKERK